MRKEVGNGSHSHQSKELKYKMSNRPSCDSDKKDRSKHQPELSDSLQISRLTNGTGHRGAARSNTALLEKAVVVTLEQEGLDLAHRVQNDTHRDQHSGAAEEDRDTLRHVELEEQHIGHDRNHRQKDSAREGHSRHDEIQKTSRRLAGTNSGNIAAVLLE